jgi:hypothetical protein
MPRMLTIKGDWLGRALRVSALAFAIGVAPAAILATGWAHATEAEGTADAGSDASASGTGEGTSSSGQESDAGASAGTSPDGGSATGSGSTEGEAQQTGDGTSIGAQTGADVDVAAETQNGVGNAKADAAAYADTDPGKKTKLTASAAATTDGVPNSEASTTKNGKTTTSATAAYRQPGTYYCSDTCTEGYSKTSKKKSVSVAVQDDAYSLAVASRKSAYAQSGALSDFSKQQQKTISKALSVGAYAYAGRNSARASAFANSFAEIMTGQGGTDTRQEEGFSGYARSSSFARATACVGGNCGKGKGSATAGVRSFTVVKDCDRTPRKVGNFVFPVCEYRVVAR